jgi:hypothetical protein
VGVAMVEKNEKSLRLSGQACTQTELFFLTKLSLQLKDTTERIKAVDAAAALVSLHSCVFATGVSSYYKILPPTSQPKNEKKKGLIRTAVELCCGCARCSTDTCKVFMKF